MPISEQSIKLQGKEFILVTTQRTEKISVYKGYNEFLRIGDRENIENNLHKHKQMLGYGLPISEIKEEGTIDNKAYYIESSLGEKHFGQLFSEDMKKAGRISNEHFAQFIEISRKFGESQLNTKIDRISLNSFPLGIHLDVVKFELEEYGDKIQEVFDRATEKIEVFPAVMTHGDFNPHNLYPKGAIDLESAFMGFAGYDLITNIVHIGYFPDSTDYEFYKGYNFVDEQKIQYLLAMDDLYIKNGLPRISEYLKEFEFFRAIWSVANMSRWPKLQQFRYDLFKRNYLT